MNLFWYKAKITHRFVNLLGMQLYVVANFSINLTACTIMQAVSALMEIIG